MRFIFVESVVECM